MNEEACKMAGKKIIRTLCYFAPQPAPEILGKLKEAEQKLLAQGYEIQTRRVCFEEKSIRAVDSWKIEESLYRSVGTLNRQRAASEIDAFLEADNVAFNLDATEGVEESDVALLFKILRENPEKTFNFAFTFNNPPSSPFFPSAQYEKEGLALGLQATDLAEEITTLKEWLAAMKTTWQELDSLFSDTPNFLGMDSSVAPLFKGRSSFVHFLKQQCGSFSQAVTTDIFLKITDFLKTENPRPVGLCGLMLPCLEDFELAGEYESGNFSMERNLYLSLHCGLGVDTFPVGMDESPERILEILSLIQQLSQKYKKALSARFVSDGKANIGQKTRFENPYLKNVIVRKL